LTRMYREWKDKPVTVDLKKMWGELGIQTGAQGIVFLSDAPEAKIREAITQRSGPVADATLVGH
jgi:predicted kinase